jgi:hypothetical protein
MAPNDGIDTALMKSVAAQLMSSKTVEVQGRALPVEKIGARRLRMVKFAMNGGYYEAIEQNASKPSTWGKLARQGHQVVQFRDIDRNKYVAVAVDGEIREYGKRAK